MVSGASKSDMARTTDINTRRRAMLFVSTAI